MNTNKHWLIIFQNNAELRPTGGFITAFAIIKFKWFFPISLSFHSSDQIKDPEFELISPPAVMSQVFKHQTKSLTFRDANCNPNLNISAQNIIKLFNHQYPEINVTSLVAVNFHLLERLIKHFRGIKLHNQKITSNNLFTCITEQTSAFDRHNLKAISSRKNILKEIAKKLFFKALISPVKTITAPYLLLKLIKEKHLLLWTKSRQQNKQLNPHHDRLQISETNLLGMKNDRYLIRSIHYHLEINQDLTATCTTKITIFHNGSENIPISGLYQGYFQAVDHNSSTTGQLIQLQPGQTKTIEFTKNLDHSFFSKNCYILDIIKQPGTLNDSILVTVKAPIDFHLQSPNFTIAENSATYKTNLFTDQTITLSLHENHLPPRINHHTIVELNRILVSFNKPIKVDPQTAGATVTTAPPKDPKNPIPIKPEQLEIGECEVLNHATSILIHTIGMQPQKEKFYHVELTGITDQSGHKLSPRSTKFTVVNRFDQ